MRRLGEKNHGRIAGRQLIDQQLRGRQLEIAIRRGIQFACPGVEKLHGRGAGGDLCLEVDGRGASDLFQELAKHARLVQEHRLCGGETFARAALNQVTRQRPGSGGESEDGHIRAQRSAKQANGIADEARLALRIEARERVHLRGRANRRSDDRARIAQFDGRAHRFGGNQNVGKYDHRIDAEAAVGLQRNLRRELGRLGHFEKGVFFAQRAILGQIAPRLAHHPHRHARNRFATAGSQEERGAAGVPGRGDKLC